ncbi:hypothetical protein TKK_0011788 [Trichogramma kaykai]
MALTAAEVTQSSFSSQQLIDLEKCCSDDYNRCKEQTSQNSLIYIHLLISMLHLLGYERNSSKILNMKNRTQDTLHNCTLQALTKSMFNNESLQIKVLKSKNNTFNKGTNYFNQSEIMNENCTKMIQVIISTIDKQSIQHEVSTYKARSITIAPPYFIRLKRFGVHHVLSRIPRPPLRNSSPDSNKINQSESALKTVLQQCNNLIIELKCEPSIFAFIITQYSQLPMTLDAFPVTNTKKYKITNEVR